MQFIPDKKKESFQMTEIERLAIVMLQRGHSWDEIIYQTKKLIQKRRREKNERSQRQCMAHHRQL